MQSLEVSMYLMFLFVTAFICFEFIHICVYRLESWTEAADLSCQGVAQEVQGDKKRPRKNTVVDATEPRVECFFTKETT